MFFKEIKIKHVLFLFVICNSSLLSKGYAESTEVTPPPPPPPPPHLI